MSSGSWQPGEHDPHVRTPRVAVQPRGGSCGVDEAHAHGLRIAAHVSDASARERITARLAAACIHPVAQIDYWQANGGVTYQDPDGREVVFASWTYGLRPRDSALNGDHPETGARWAAHEMPRRLPSPALSSQTPPWFIADLSRRVSETLRPRATFPGFAIASSTRVSLVQDIGADLHQCAFTQPAD